VIRDILSKPEIVIAAASAVIAFCALGLAIVQSFQIRKHYRLSVKPYLVFYISFGTETVPLGLHLANNGVGPAVIKRLNIFLDNQPFSTPTGHPWNMVWMKAGYNKPAVAYSFPDEETVLRVREIFPLLAVDKGFESDTERYEFSQALKRVDLKVHYESVYGERKIAELEKSKVAHQLNRAATTSPYMK
jgi:hypothetical protein